SQVFLRISGFTNCLFKAYALHLYLYFCHTLDNIMSHYPSLKRPFSKFVFAISTFNFGPCTIFYPHHNWANLMWGWCIITPHNSLCQNLAFKHAHHCW
ncbi:hypothetical protein BDZ97DRAFT_1679760, partial [Flammula alnicola]